MMSNVHHERPAHLYIPNPTLLTNSSGGWALHLHLHLPWRPVSLAVRASSWQLSEEKMELPKHAERPHWEKHPQTIPENNPTTNQSATSCKFPDSALPADVAGCWIIVLLMCYSPLQPPAAANNFTLAIWVALQDHSMAAHLLHKRKDGRAL